MNIPKNMNGSEVANLLYGQNIKSHYYIDSLQRFHKDFAELDRKKRQQQKMKRQAEIQKKRLEYLERENRRWQNFERQYKKVQENRQININLQIQGKRKTPNLNSLPYNPINLQYQKSKKGQKLKMMDQDILIRKYVRAHNMDSRGNSRFNLLTGQNRIRIQNLVPQQLHDRFEKKLNDHYDHYKLRIQSSKQDNIKY